MGNRRTFWRQGNPSVWERLKRAMVRLPYLLKKWVCYNLLGLRTQSGEVMVNHWLCSTGARDIIIMTGNIRAKIGGQNIRQQRESMEWGKWMKKARCLQKLVSITELCSPTKQSTKQLMSPEHVAENQTDHIYICKKFRRTMEGVRTRRGADAASANGWNTTLHTSTTPRWQRRSRTSRKAIRYNRKEGRHGLQRRNGNT